jgi:tetraacyldisaccharide 4'-kinase
MYGRKKSLFRGTALSALSLLYGTALHVRQLLFTLRVLKRKELTCAVISVGNITIGGTGKTPTVINIADLLLKNRRHPVVVSRGYGRKNESEALVVSDGKSVLVDSKTGGDEPVLIGHKVSGVPVIVGRKRHQAAREALQRFSSDVVVLDDGFQHIQLRRTLDIALVDATDPFGNGKLFPAGILREPLTALKRAHAVLITKADQTEDVEQSKHIIRANTRARIFTSRLCPLDVVDCRSGELRPLSFLQGVEVLALSGIARPASFTTLLRSLGAVVSAECIYPDHHDFKKTELADVYKKAADRKIGMIITTEKDAVRLRHFKPEGIHALRVELCVNEREEWERMILEQKA